MHGLPLLQVVAVGMLILANAFFVAAEFAMVSTRDTRIEQLLANKVPGARAVRRLQLDIEYFLPAVQLGVTLCSLAIGWIGEPMAAGVVLGWINMLPHPVAYAQVYAHAASLTAVALGFCVITYFHVTIGELVPKSLALRRAEALAVAVAPPMLMFMKMARPAVRMLKASAAVLLRGFDIPMTERAAVHSPEELKLITTAARRLGLFPKFQEMLIHRAIELDDVPVREIMTPRQRIFSLPSNMPLEEASAQVIEHMNSRVPVYDETRGPEHIIGVIYSKDLSRLMFFRRRGQQRAVATAPTQTAPAEGAAESTAGAQRAGNQQLGLPFMELRLRQVMRDVLVVPETKSALALLREFQQRRRQMAIVVDEYGSIVGLVTAEDAIEQLTGELEDEFDDPARPVLANAQGTLVLEGSANLRDLETQMQWSLPRDGGVETLAGFMLTRLGHIPRSGESIEFDNRRLTVLEMEGRRIAKIQVEPINPEPAG
ncbi:hemolysin family protein [Occallatibacter savannae]|uniref:hemolysin family protein n=1 Tax=Occallatibacter savannae TaxID=1002691 RepID=UPI000D694B83|nr:hemolysin family protein [Occallatibacter savannae]